MNPVSMLTRTAGVAFTLARRTLGRIIGGLPGVSAGEQDTWQQTTDEPRTPPIRETADRAVAREMAEPVAGAPDEPDAEEPGVTTPSGIPAAEPGHNPDTVESDLFQPDTEPLMDPATTKAVRSEAEMLRKASERDKS